MDIVFFAAAAVIVGLSLWWRKRHRALALLLRDHERVLASGQRAVGVIRRLTRTNLVGGTRLRPVHALDLEIEVTVAGEEPYVLRTRQLVDELRAGSVQPGSRVHLLVAAEDRQQVALTDAPPAPSAAGTEPSEPTGPALPLFDATHLRLGNGVLTAALWLALAGIVVPYLVFMVNWRGLSPPEGGFCAAAARCCAAVPAPAIDLGAYGFKPLATCDDIPSTPADGKCQRLYEHYKETAEAAGRSCEAPAR